MKRVKQTPKDSKAAFKEMLLMSIRKRYSVDDEFRIVNQGMASKDDVEYVEYRKFISDAVSVYREKVKNHG